MQYRINPSNNIYNSYNISRIGDLSSVLAKKKFNDQYSVKQSFREQKTNYNSYNDEDTDFSDQDDIESMASVKSTRSEVLNNPINTINAMNKLIDNSKYEQRIKNSNRNGFLSQFDDLKYDNNSQPVSMNAVSSMSNPVSRIERERSLALDGRFSMFNNNSDMTYGVVRPSDFQTSFDSMKPSYKSKSYGNDEYEMNKQHEISQRKVEQFTGSVNNPEYRHRTENKPLFNPMVGLSNIYGTPVMTQFLESRYIPGMNRQGEKPFQEQRITPGLGLGYNEIGTQGYHDTFRVLPKTVNELRVANNPKVTYESRTVDGIKEKRGPIAGKTYKRRPLTFYETDAKRPLEKARSYFTAQKSRENYDPTNMATINRGMKDTSYHGPAKSKVDVHAPDSMIAKVRDSFKKEEQQADPRNVQAPQAKQARGFNESYDNKPTQREKDNNYIGPAGVSELGKSYAYDKNTNMPDINMRNVHDQTDRAGNLGNNQFNKTYVYDTFTNVPEFNMRNVHDTPDRAGHLNNSANRNSYAYNQEDNIPELNMRNIHDSSDRAGHLNGKKFEQGYVFDFNTNVPELNMRNIHDSPDRAGQLGNAEFTKGHAFDMATNMPDFTMRNIHENRDRAGNMGTSQYHKNYAFSLFSNMPDANMRNIHENADRAGNMGNMTFMRKEIAFDFKNAIPDQTMRTVHDSYDRAGNSLGYHEKQRSRSEANSMRVNTANEEIAKGRAPTLSNYNKGPTIDFTVVTLNTPLQIDRELYPEPTMNLGQVLQGSTTRVKAPLDQQSEHFFTFVDENLQGNPYINNLLHKAV
jgi:hypothetical protein